MSDRGQLQEHIVALRQRRETEKAADRQPRPRRLTKAQRAEILEKTGGKCHICGGEIKGKWEADHVLASSRGGEHAADNYLPAHSTCNNYRWDYLPEELELILKLGVWARTQIEKCTTLGQAIEEAFSRHEERRLGRHKKA